MALKFKNNKDFSLKLRDDDLRAENTAHVKGGFVVVGDRWVPFGDLRIDIRSVVSEYMSSASRRVFNFRGDVIYVLICVDKLGTPKVVPSIAMNKRSYGDIKVFPSLSGLLPLMLVRLRHDGSEDLSSMLPIGPHDVELYKGYGNFTTIGARGITGLQGFTGYQGITGFFGIKGHAGITGVRGVTGLVGFYVVGETGMVGQQGAFVPAFQSSATSYVQDVVDDTVDTWIDVVDDTGDTIQDTL